jgi:hypothetical protein
MQVNFLKFAGRRSMPVDRQYPWHVAARSDTIDETEENPKYFPKEFDDSYGVV